MNSRTHCLSTCSLLFLLSLLVGCGSDETNSAGADNDDNILVETGDQDVPYIAFNRDGSSLAVTGDSVTEITGVYTTPSGNKILIVTNENGEPIEAHFDNASLVFDNVRSNLIDVAVLVDGELVQIFRDINFVNENIALLGLLRPSNENQYRTSHRGVRDLMRALVIAAGAAACSGTAIVSATATLGVALPTVAAACASPILGLYVLANPPAALANGDLSNEEYAVMIASSLVTSAEAGICAAGLSPLDCLLTLADASHSVFDALDFRRRVLSPEIAAAQSTLGSTSSSFTVLGYQNIDSSFGQDISLADIKLSGTTATPIISWPRSTATLLQVVQAQTYSLVYGISAEPLTNNNGDDITIPLTMPVLYGNYSLANIDTDTMGPTPSPALLTNVYYSVLIVDESISPPATATLLFSTN